MKIALMLSVVFICAIGISQAQAQAEIAIGVDQPTGDLFLGYGCEGSIAWIFVIFYDGAGEVISADGFEVGCPGSDILLIDIPPGAAQAAARIEVVDYPTSTQAGAGDRCLLY